MIRVAAYCRVSTDKDDQINSFESQKRYFSECIGHHPDWLLEDIYADEGLSGTTTRKRAEFSRMIQAAREGKIDLIITKEVSRFARNTLDVLDYTRRLRRMGIGVIFLLDHINTLDLDGELRLTIMSSIAQEESRKTSERVKWGQTRSMEHGIVFGRDLLGYHVVRGQLIPEPSGAALVKRIFHLYVHEAMGSGAIARELTRLGLRNVRGNTRWTGTSILRILKNEKYCGDLIQKKTFTPDYLSHDKKYNHGEEKKIQLCHHHEAIIDRDTWEAAQREMARRCRNCTHPACGNSYPLSGKIICGQCGSFFTARMKYIPGPYRIWRCGKLVAEGSIQSNDLGQTTGCDIGKQLRDDAAMDIVKRSVRAVLTEPEVVVQTLLRLIEPIIRRRKDGCCRELAHLEQMRSEKQTQKLRAMELCLDGTLSRSDFELFNQNCDKELAALQTKLETARAAQEDDSDPVRSFRLAICHIVMENQASDAFFTSLLECITVGKGGTAEVVLTGIGAKWTYQINRKSRQRAHDAASVPISVRTAFSSGKGMA